MTAKRKPLTRVELDEVQCGNPNCPSPGDCQIALGGRCHPGEGVDVVYDKSKHLLVVRCHTCERLVVEIRPSEGYHYDAEHEGASLN